MKEVINNILLIVLSITILCSCSNNGKIFSTKNIELVKDSVLNPYNNSILETCTLAPDSSIIFYSRFNSNPEKADFSFIKFHNFGLLYEMATDSSIRGISEIKKIKYEKNKPQYTLDGYSINFYEGSISEFENGKLIKTGKIVWD